MGRCFSQISGTFLWACLKYWRIAYNDRPAKSPGISGSLQKSGVISRSPGIVKKTPGIRLFANDVIMIRSVRADWPGPFSVTIGNPRADKLGRNGFECIGRRCLVDRERCVRATFMHRAIENYSMLHLQRGLECRGIKRFGTKSLFMIISHNCQSCMCRQ